LNPLTGHPSSVVLDYIDLHDSVREPVENYFNIDFKRARALVYGVAGIGKPEVVMQSLKPFEKGIPDSKDPSIQSVATVETVTVPLEPFMGIDDASFRVGHNYDEGRSVVSVNKYEYDTMEKRLTLNTEGESEKYCHLMSISHHFLQAVWEFDKAQLLGAMGEQTLATTFSCKGVDFDLRDLPMKFLRYIAIQAKGAKGHGGVPAHVLMKDCAIELNPDKADYLGM
jgi:hypothetical protein